MGITSIIVEKALRAGDLATAQTALAKHEIDPPTVVLTSQSMTFNTISKTEEHHNAT